MVGSVAGDLPEQVKNNQSVNLAAGNGGQKMSQYSWFTVYDIGVAKPADRSPFRQDITNKFMVLFQSSILSESHGITIED